MVKRRFQLGLLVTASLLVGALFFEAGVALYYLLQRGPGSLIMTEGYDSPYIFNAKPHTSISEEDVEYRFNNYSMRRSVDVTQTPKRDTARILSYGDSIANGWLVPEAETYSSRLEQYLNSGGDRKYEVLNMFRGVSPTVASFHIRRDVPRFRPHGLIIEIELLNDISDEAHILIEDRDEYGLPLAIRRSRYILGWDGHLLSALTFSGSFIERSKTWSMTSRLLGQVFNRWKKLRDPRAPLLVEDPDSFFYHMDFDRFQLTEKTLQRGFDEMFNSLRDTHRFLQKHNVRFLLVIIPSRYVFSHGRYQETSLKQFRRAEVRARGLGLPFISVYRELEEAGGASVFMDFCHPTGEGNRAIARAIYPTTSSW